VKTGVLIRLTWTSLAECLKFYVELTLNINVSEAHVKYSSASASRVHFALSCVVACFQMRDLAARNHLATSMFVGLPILLPRVPARVNSFFQQGWWGEVGMCLCRKTGKARENFRGVQPSCSYSNSGSCRMFSRAMRGSFFFGRNSPPPPVGPGPPHSRGF